MIKLYTTLFLLFFINNLFSNPIKIIGLDRLSYEDLNTITNIDLKQDDFNRSDISKLIDELYKSDLIYDVKLTTNEKFYLLEIIENKIIQNIFFINNSWIKDELLFEIIETKKNDLISKSQISKDIKSINAVYKSKGFNEILTIAKLEAFSSDRVNLIYEINEGKQAKLNLIKFLGNHYFSDRYISSRITSQDLSFYNIFKSGSNLNPEIFNFDKSQIENLYKNKGFFDVKVSYDLQSNNFGLYLVNFYIDEGQRYKLNDIKYSSKLDKINDFEKIKKKYQKKFQKNKEYFDQILLDNYLDDLNKSLHKNNYFNFYFVSKINKKDSFVDIEIIDIIQNPKTVNKIEFYGNTITKDKTVRSKILIEPGDYINETLINNSISNLKKFSYINDINYSINELSNNSADINFTLDEKKKTGNILFAGTFDSDTELGFMFGIEDKNFAGSGNILDANFNINAENVKYDLNYTQFPLNNPFVSNTYSIFNQEDDLTSSFGYESQRIGVGYSLNFSDNDEVRYGFGLSYEDTTGFNPKQSISAINDNIGNFQNIIFKFNINKDTTNDIFNPSKGHYNSLSMTISPPEISDDPFLKLIFSNKNYFNFKDSDSYIFLNNNYGYAESLKSKLKTINSFSLGGNNFKGFDFRGVGPVTNNIYLGGNQFFTSTLGYGSSFIFDEKDNINIKFFISAGSIWDSDYSSSDNEFDLRASTGVSLDFITAIGPISFSYATPLIKKDNDQERVFAFTIGKSFW